MKREMAKKNHLAPWSHRSQRHGNVYSINNNHNRNSSSIELALTIPTGMIKKLMCS